MKYLSEKNVCVADVSHLRLFGKFVRARNFADEVRHPAGMYRMFVGVTCKLVCEVTPTNIR